MNFLKLILIQKRLKCLKSGCYLGKNRWMCPVLAFKLTWVDETRMADDFVYLLLAVKVNHIYFKRKEKCAANKKLVAWLPNCNQVKGSWSPCMSGLDRIFFYFQLSMLFNENPNIVFSNSAWKKYYMKWGSCSIFDSRKC